MTAPDGLLQDADTIKTYRYVRLAMVGLVVGIFAAVLIQRRTAGTTGFLPSISDYYSTPARGMFVAALLAIGVCLVCIRGGSTAEDVLLNVAGMLAPVVALVPTPPDSHDPNIKGLLADLHAGVTNNFPALLVIAAFAVVVLLCLIAKAFVGTGPRPSKGNVAGFGLATALVLAAYIWYSARKESFLDGAHFTAAITMFACIAGTAIVDGIHAIGGQNKKTRGRVYIAIGASMLLAGGGIIGYDMWIQSWKHAVLAAEAILIFLFAVFWAMQTVDLWNYTSRKQAISAANQVVP
ncbi:MAG: hypothetical protein QOC73_1269 [Actinomycetota bacterium]|jgi:hypothetical protein|nr:hypothetical protein [Actinomycetota bacterium]